MNKLDLMIDYYNLPGNFQKEFRVYTCPNCDPLSKDPDVLSGNPETLKYMVFKNLKCKICGSFIVDLNVSEKSMDDILKLFPERKPREV